MKKIGFLILMSIFLVNPVMSQLTNETIKGEGKLDDMAVVDAVGAIDNQLVLEGLGEHRFLVYLNDKNYGVKNVIDLELLFPSILDDDDDKVWALSKFKGNYLVALANYDRKKDTEIYIALLNQKGDVIKNPVLVYKYGSDDNSDYRLLTNKEADVFAVIIEQPVEELESVNMQYHTYNENLQLENAGNIKAPIERKEKSGLFSSKEGLSGLLDEFSLHSSGFIYGTIFIEGNEKKDEESYQLLIDVDTKNNKTRVVDYTPPESKSLSYRRIKYNGKTFVVSGIFREDREEKKFLQTKDFLKGTFYIEMDIATGEALKSSFVSFDEDFLLRLNARNTMISNRKRDKAAKKDDVESLNSAFRFLSSKFMENGDLVVLGEFFHNYVTKTTSSNGATTTTYHSIRGNLISFRINKNSGELEWFDNTRRYLKLSSSNSSVWNRRMHQTVFFDDDVYLLYNSRKLYNLDDPSDFSGEVLTKKEFLAQRYIQMRLNLKTGQRELEIPPITKKRSKDAHLHFDLTSPAIFVNDSEKKMIIMNQYVKRGFMGLGMPKYSEYSFSELRF